MKNEEVKDILIKAISDEMGITSSEINDDDTFYSLGMDSVTCIFVMERLENQLKIELNPLYFWDYPDVKSFSAQLAELTSKHNA